MTVLINVHSTCSIPELVRHTDQKGLVSSFAFVKVDIAKDISNIFYCVLRPPQENAREKWKERKYHLNDHLKSMW